MADKLPKLVEDVVYAQQNRLLDDPVGRSAQVIVHCDVADDFIINLISNRVQRHRIAQAFVGPIPTPRLNDGELVLGMSAQGKPIRMPVQFLNGHSLTVGGTGSGKTTKSRFLILQMARRLDGMWLFDFRKREYAILRPYLKRLGIDLTVIPGRSMRLNPLQVPDGVGAAEWAPRVADLLVQVLRLPPRATKLLHTSVFELFRRHGVFERSQSFPTTRELRKAIADQENANLPAKQAILDSLDPVLMSLGAALDYRRGWSVRELARRHLVFELGGLSEVDKDLILNTLVLSEFTSRLARGLSNSRMDLWICCDEAGRLVSASNHGNGIADLISLVRGTGVGLDLSVQSADLLPAVLSNTANKFVGRCGSAADYDLIGSAMGLTVEQRRWMALHLQPGMFVGQVGEGDWRQPFVLQIPPMSLRQSSDVTGADNGHAQMDNLPSQPASAPEAIPFTASGSADDVQPTGGNHDRPLSDAETRYLRSIIEHPGRPSSAYPKLAGIGPRLAQSIRKRLIHEGYLREHSMATGSRGRNAIVLEPLDRAHQAVGSAKPTPEPGS